MKLKNDLPVLMAKNGYKTLKQLAQDTKITYFRLRQFANQQNQTIDYEIVEKLCSHFNCDIVDLFHLDKQ